MGVDAAGCPRRPHRTELSVAAFAAGAAAILLISRSVVASSAYAARPTVFAAAVTWDLSVTAAVLFWFTLVRGGIAPPASAVAVLLGGLSVAAAVLPPGERALPLRAGTWAAPLELLIVARLGIAARKLAQKLAVLGNDQPFEVTFRDAARGALGPNVLAEALSTEVAFSWMAFCSWRKAPHVPSGTRAFSTARRVGFGAVVGAVLIAGVGETVGLHFLVARWSGTAAWVLTALSVYSALWLVGEWRALELRPVLLTATALEIRIGLRWRARVPRSSITAVCSGPDERGHPGAPRASALGAPNLYVHADEEIVLHGLFGRTRRAACVGLRVDDPEALRAALTPRA